MFLCAEFVCYNRFGFQSNDDKISAQNLLTVQGKAWNTQFVQTCVWNLIMFFDFATPNTPNDVLLDMVMRS